MAHGEVVAVGEEFGFGRAHGFFLVVDRAVVLRR
jgi:hypothetical protein